MNPRPHCEKPEACAARGARHCRRCNGLLGAARLKADPAVQERLQHVLRHPTAQATANRSRAMRRLNEDPVFAAARDASARCSIRGLHNKETFAKSKAARLKRTARRAGIPEELVPEYRILKDVHKLTREQAVGILARTHQTAFKTYQQAQVAKQRRIIVRSSAGPVTATLMGDPTLERSALRASPSLPTHGGAES